MKKTGKRWMSLLLTLVMLLGLMPALEMKAEAAAKNWTPDERHQWNSVEELQAYALSNWVKPIREAYYQVNNGREFGAYRSGRLHAAIDYYVENGDGTNVYAMTNGTVKYYWAFYANVYALVVKNDDGSVLNYGEIVSPLEEGARVTAGEPLGQIRRNSEDGGTMLHLELYLGMPEDWDYLKPGFSNWLWKNSTISAYERRSDLLDPTFLLQITRENPCVYSHEAGAKENGVWNFKTIQKSDGTYTAVCKYCETEFVPNPTLDTSTAGIYKVNTANGKLCTAPYQDSSILCPIKGAEYTIVGSVTNAYNSKWYKTNDGDWIYSGDVDWVRSLPKPSTPTNLTATKIDDRNARISWSAVSGATSYGVEYKREGIDWTVDTDYTGGTSYQSTNLSYDPYYFRVCAKNSAGSSDWVTVTYYRNGNTTPDPPSPSARPIVGYSYTTQGSAVSDLQTMLNKVIGAGLDVDGIFGNATYNAIIVYQNQKGLTADGICGSSTWAALEADYNAAAAKPSNAWIQANKSSVSVGESITFTYGAKNATSYTLSIHRIGGVINTILAGTATSYAKSFSESGDYTIYVTASNSEGGTDSNTISFSVLPTLKPSNPWLTVTPTSQELNSPITFSYGADHVVNYYLKITHPGGMTYSYQTYTTTGSTKETLTFDKTGTYSAIAIFSDSNNVSIQSETVYFTIGTPESYTISLNVSVTPDGTLHYDIKNADIDKALLLIAEYDGTGRMLRVNQVIPSSQSDDISVGDAERYQAFLLNRNTYAPLCAAAEWKP